MGYIVMEVDQIVQGDDGLPAITDSDICSSNREEDFVCEVLFDEYF